MEGPVRERTEPKGWTFRGLGARLGVVASYLVNERAVAKARELINARRYVGLSTWSEVLHRMCLIGCHYRAAEWGHKEVELAAHDLLQYLDGKRA